MSLIADIGLDQLLMIISSELGMGSCSPCSCLGGTFSMVFIQGVLYGCYCFVYCVALPICLPCTQCDRQDYVLEMLFLTQYGPCTVK